MQLSVAFYTKLLALILLSCFITFSLKFLAPAVENIATSNSPIDQNFNVDNSLEFNITAPNTSSIAQICDSKKFEDVGEKISEILGICKNLQSENIQLKRNQQNMQHRLLTLEKQNESLLNMISAAQNSCSNTSTSINNICQILNHRAEYYKKHSKLIGSNSLTNIRRSSSPNQENLIVFDNANVSAIADTDYDQAEIDEIPAASSQRKRLRLDDAEQDRALQQVRNTVKIL